MAPKAIIESDGDRRECEVVSTWICTTTHVRYVVLRVPMDADDPDDLEEIQEAMENEEASAPSRKRGEKGGGKGSREGQGQG